MADGARLIVVGDAAADVVIAGVVPDDPRRPSEVWRYDVAGFRRAVEADPPPPYLPTPALVAAAVARADQFGAERAAVERRDRRRERLALLFLLGAVGNAALAGFWSGVLACRWFGG